MKLQYMLESIHVKNIALIDEVEVELNKGLNVLTGETGAGKSIIIDAVNFALGARMPKDIVRNENEYALSELVFSMDERAAELFNREMIPLDNRIIMQRKVLNGKNVCKVNGESVTASFLKELAGVLIDIHGQHEHQSLLYKKKHMEILDGYCGKEFEEVLAKNHDDYACYLKLSSELADSLKDDKDRAREMSLAEFELNEIMEANLNPGEDDELETDYRRMLNSKRIMEAVGEAYSCSGYDMNEGAGCMIGRAVSAMRQVNGYDDNASDLLQLITDIDGLLNDFNRSLSDYRDSLTFTEEEYIRVEERLNLINHLKMKYGHTIEDILEYAKTKEEELNKYSDYDGYVLDLKMRTEKMHEEVLDNCRQMSEIRKNHAFPLRDEIVSALCDLNFPDVRFEVSIASDEEHLSGNGYDDIEFMISLNPGEKLKTLTNVASGGELSRIMLALKAVLAKKDDIGTLIFDEIDTGISGRTAQKVSEKLALISGTHQVICVTHLPQIAAMADTHFEIKKSVVGDRTITGVTKLDGSEETNELARMLGGTEITDAVLENAAEMKRLANDYKAKEAFGYDEA